jgi:formylmethanofuran dehydrogenase subunit D
MAQHFQPSPQLGIFPQFCAQQQMTLVMKEKVFSFSGDDFAVKDQFGNVVIRCQGKALSWSDKKGAFTSTYHTYKSCMYVPC